MMSKWNAVSANPRNDITVSEMKGNHIRVCSSTAQKFARGKGASIWGQCLLWQKSSNSLKGNLHLPATSLCNPTDLSRSCVNFFYKYLHEQNSALCCRKCVFLSNHNSTFLLKWNGKAHIIVHLNKWAWLFQEKEKEKKKKLSFSYSPWGNPHHGACHTLLKKGLSASQVRKICSIFFFYFLVATSPEKFWQPLRKDVYFATGHIQIE